MPSDLWSQIAGVAPGLMPPGVSAAGAPVSMPGDAANAPPAPDVQQSTADTFNPQIAAASAATYPSQTYGGRKRSTLSLMLEGFLRGFGNALGARIPDYEERDFQQQMAMRKLQGEEQDRAMRASRDNMLAQAEQLRIKNDTPLPANHPDVLALRRDIPSLPDGGYSPNDIRDYRKDLIKNKLGGKDVMAVKTVDDKGNPVTKLVPKESGAEYPEQQTSADMDSRVIKILADQKLGKTPSPEDQATAWAYMKLLRDKKQAIHIDSGGSSEHGALMVVPDGQGGTTLQRIIPGQQVAPGAHTVTQEGAFGGKASADEQRRADLGNNLNENISAYEDIVKRRPDLFGPVNGRITRLKMMAGSTDSDIAALRAIKEFAGMAAVGTHAMRNAQHVRQASDAMMNLNDTADAILGKGGPLEKARGSIQTFIDDVENKNPPSGNQPRVGDTKTFPNGRRGRWDGHGWVAQ